MSSYADLYRSLYRIRRVEEEVARVYPSDKIKSPVHLSIGQEAVAVGVCETLLPEDIVFITYRSHAAYLAKGGDLKQMVAEMYGKATGCAKGKGGSMHLIDVAHGVMGASAVVGTNIADAAGYAYGLKYQRKNALVVCFFGDGASDEGVFHESMNFAVLKHLPVIYVCENNQYAIHTHQAKRQSKTEIYQRAKMYGMPAERIEGNDVLEIHRQVGAAVDAIRSGQPGPYFFECMTYRWREHVGPNEDFGLGYRSRDEARPWVESDQIVRLGAMLAEQEKQQIDAAVEAEIRDAFEFAEESPFPCDADLYTDVFQEA